MRSFPDQNQVQRACLQTWEALDLSVGTAFNQDEISIFLKYLLLEGLDFGEVRSWRLHGQTDLPTSLPLRLKGLLTQAQQGMIIGGELPNVKGISWDALNYILSASLIYRQRLICITMEAVLSEPMSPELCLKYGTATRYDLSVVLPGTWNHAVIFESPVFFTNEFYPLAVDAFVYDSEHYGNQRTNVLGVHTDWLTSEGKLKRILYLDVDNGRLVETDVEFAIQPESVHFLCLGHQEQENHKAISERINCVQVNPSKASMLADDKAATLAGWSAMGLEVPAFQEIAPRDMENAYHFFNRFEEIVVKPNKATEGELVAFFQRSHPQARIELQHHLERCWENGEAIVQQRRDGICFRDPVSGKYHSLALRFNLTTNRGGGHRLESGYVQLGQDEHSPAACGQKGRIVRINEVLPNLFYSSTFGNKRFHLSSNDWTGIREQAEQAARLFEGLMLIGLDVLLDHDQHGKICPVFLEANPRPAGLSHSRLLVDDPWQPAVNGVTLNLWGHFDLSRQYIGMA